MSQHPEISPRHNTDPAATTHPSNQRQHLTKPPGIWILAFMASVGPFGDTEYVPSLSSIATHFQTTYSAVIITMTAYLIAYAISQLFYGPLSDHYGRRPVILAGSLLFILGSILCVVSTHLHTLIVGRFIQALGACAGTVIAFAAVRDAYPLTEQTTTFARINAAFTIAPALGPMIGGFVDHIFGWRANFVVLLVVACMLYICIKYFFNETHANYQRSALQLKAVLKHYTTLFKKPGFVFYLLVIGLCIGMVYNCLTEAPALLIGIMHYSSRIFILVAVCVTLSFVIGSLASGYLNHHLHSVSIIILGFMIILLAAITMITATYAQHLNLISILVPVGCMFFGIALILPVATARALAPFGHIAGSASAMLGFFQMGFAASCTALLSYLRNGSAYTMPISFLSLSVLALIVVACSYKCVSRKCG